MKKSRFIYHVTRSTLLDKGKKLCYNTVILDSFKTPEAADDKKAAYEQKDIDKPPAENYVYKVDISSYYDE